MTRFTDRFGLSILGPGSHLQDDGYKFTDADRRLIDRLLYVATELHHHNGISGTDASPAVAPAVTVASIGGAIPSGTRYFYRYTLVDPDGNETAPSPIAPADTPFPVNPPSAPTLSYSATGGTLGPGSYSYVLSGHTTANTLETKAINSSFISVFGSTSTNSITLTLPARPPGALGYNIFRKSPSGLHYLWLAAVAAPTPLQTWVDTGATDGDCDRSLAATNRTSNSNTVTVTLPGATPYVPDGYSWRLYRSTNPNKWEHSYLTEVFPMGATPTTAVSYVDIGSATQVGGPPNKALVVSSPPKINMTNGTEVQGSLPPGLNVVPYLVTFSIPGPVTVAPGAFTWVCDFTEADIVSCRAHLGVDSVPAAADVVADLQALRPATSGAWATLYTTTANRPKVTVGDTIGTPTTPDLVHLVAGDALAVDVTQAGGGATPTDVDLTVTVLLMVRTGSTTVSHVWAI